MQMPDDWVKINLLDTAVRVCKMKESQVAEHPVDTQSILISFISIVNCINSISNAYYTQFDSIAKH